MNAKFAQYTFDFVNYNYSRDYTRLIRYKDYQKRSFRGANRFLDVFSDLGLHTPLSSVDNLFVWRFQNKMLSKMCYSLQYSGNKGGLGMNYQVSAKAEYTLAKASELDYSVEKHTDEVVNRTLTTLVSIKHCKIGFFMNLRV